jgi:hypothetical protein
MTDLIDAIQMVTEASVLDVFEAIKNNWDEEQIEIVSDSLAYLAVMLKFGGKENV